ncbi:MAG: metallophosphoesterase family protein [Candidatus Merdivicinus sp.]|jgi:hypothetical protein
MKSPLAFHNGKFKLMVFSDAHAALTGIDPRTMAALEALLDAEKPDFIVINGDLSKGTIDSAEAFENFAAAFIKPIEERGIYWCHTYGNHDEQYITDPSLNKEYQQKVWQSFPHCLSERGPENVPGVGNYVLNILSSDQSQPVFRIWALDSLMYLTNHEQFRKDDKLAFHYPNNPFGDTNYDFMKFEQVEWYYHRSMDLEQECGRKIPGLMFFHMALPEHRLIPAHPKGTGMVGECNEPICNSPINSGMFAAILQRGDIRGVFVGHDHINDFVGELYGIQLGFDAGLGFTTYGMKNAENDQQRHFMRGARFFDIDEQDPANYRTYMRYAREFGIY